MSTLQHPESDRAWSVEQNGINPISHEERHGKPFELFWIWFAANIGILGVVFGAYLVGYKLNLWQSIFVALVATAVSFVLVGILSIAGVWGGAPMLTLSRAVFGTRGNIGPALVSWISLVGWETFLVVTASYALLGLLQIFGLAGNAFWTVVSLVINAGLVIACGWWGHATLVRIQQISTWVFGLLTLVVVIFLIPQTNWQAVLNQGWGPLDTGVITGFIVIMAGTGIGWINMGADYARYLPRSSAGRSITFWTVIGGTLPLLVLMLVGVLLASRHPELATASDPISLIGSGLPAWMAIPYLLTAIGGLLPAAALDIYSSGLNLLSIGIKIKRQYAVFIDGILMVAGAIYIMLIRQDFFGPFISFLTLLAVGLLTWAGIFMVDMIWRRHYDSESLANTTPTSAYYYTAGFNLPACISWLVGVVIGLLLTKSIFSWTGVLALGSVLENTNLGYIIGAGVSAVLYLILRAALPTSRVVTAKGA